jgi:hypothetical protein
MECTRRRRLSEPEQPYWPPEHPLVYFGSGPNSSGAGGRSSGGGGGFGDEASGNGGGFGGGNQSFWWRKSWWKSLWQYIWCWISNNNFGSPDSQAKEHPHHLQHPAPAFSLQPDSGHHRNFSNRPSSSNPHGSSSFPPSGGQPSSYRQRSSHKPQRMPVPTTRTTIPLKHNVNYEVLYCKSI